MIHIASIEEGKTISQEELKKSGAILLIFDDPIERKLMIDLMRIGSSTGLPFCSDCVDEQISSESEKKKDPEINFPSEIKIQATEEKTADGKPLFHLWVDGREEICNTAVMRFKREK